MKDRFNIQLIARHLLLVTLSLIAFIAFQQDYYSLSVLFLLATVLWTYKNIKFQRMVLDDVRRTIRAIEFSEFNVSFKRRIDQHFYPELAAEMEKAIKTFDAMAQQKEALNSFFDILLNRVDFALIVANEAEEIIWINKAAAEVFAKSSPRRLEELQPEDHQIHSTLTNLQPNEVKLISLHDAPGEKLAVTVSLIQVKGRVLKVFNFKNIQPIIERTETDAWKKLIRVLTHEIMNSLAPIISLSETFSEGMIMNGSDYADPDTVNKVMQTIHKRSKGLTQFVANYQKVAKDPALHLSNICFSEMMENITALLRGENIRFSMVCQPPELNIIADRGQMEQVLINLIKNAWDACSKRDNPEIDVSAEKMASGRTIITVRDNGTGMPENVRDKIFIPFFTTKKNGTGIGLSLCREIINAHGGTITVASKYNHGTSVTIML